MIEKLIITGYFLVQFVDWDDGRYNVLLVKDFKRQPDMIATWTQDEKEFKVGDIIFIRAEAECTRVYEVLEGNGKRGSPWRAEDDWYLNSRPYICNADKVEIIHE